MYTDHIFGKKTVFLLILLFSTNVNAQILKGKITDLQGNPIEYATIFISEIQTGCTTSELGDFIIYLKPGNYTCIIQHLSYQTVSKTIQFPQQSYLEVKMGPKAILLREVNIGSGNEDIAYSIIRKTVAKSPYYEKQLLRYTTTFYAKGSMKIKEIPKLASKFLEKEVLIRKGDIYTEESISEVVVMPEKTTQKVISKRSSYPKMFDMGSSSFGYYNIYRSTNGGFISPVTKKGLSSYRYQWQYSYLDNDLLIHHIKVIPKNNNPFTFSGYIDIIEGTWHVYNFDFKGSIDLGIGKADFHIKETFIPLEDNVWMPGSLHQVFDAKAMGSNFLLTSIYSIRYKEYEINPIINSPNPAAEILPSVSMPDKKPVVSKKSEKLTKEIAEIMEKESFTTREAIRLVDLVEAKEKEDLKNNPKNDSINPLELQRRFFMTEDSNATNYDSARWDEYRTIPLSEEETYSFVQKQVKDSILEERNKEKQELLSTKRNTKIFKTETFYMGIGWLQSTLAFNTVEGFKIGANIYANKRFKDSVTSLNNAVNFGYAFASKHFFFDISSKWRYNPKRFASLELFGGKQTVDFKQEEQNGKYFVNSISSLFFRDNLIQYYDRIFAGARHEIEAFNGFLTSIALSYEQQRPQDNRSDYSFFFRKKREYNANIPDNEYLRNEIDYISEHNTFLLDISISYTPKMFYRYYQNGKVKHNVRSKYPTFTLTWKKAISNILGSNSQFDYLEFNIAQDIDFGFLKTLKYNVSTGFFPHTKSVHFSSFKHFQSNNFWVVFNQLHSTFNTMPNYRYSTNEWFVAGHIKYETPYLVLKYLPGLNKTLITENLHLSFLSNPLTKGYIEVGYSLSKIYFIGNVGAFVGFDEFKKVYWSIRVGFSLFE